MKTNSDKRFQRAGWMAGLALAWLAGLAPGAAAEAERVEVTVGAMRLLDLPFEMAGFRVTDPEIVKGEAVGVRQLRVIGLKVGTSDVQVTGAGTVSRLYSVSVVENIREVLSAMKRDLDSLPELELTVNRNLVVIKGEVSNVAHWQLLQKVLAAYDKQFLNLATFRPAPEVMLTLKDALEKSGLKVSTETEAPPVGTVGLRFSGNAVYVGGSVYSPNDIDKVKAAIAVQDWLTLEKPAAGEAKVQAVMNLRVEPVMIELDVVYVGLTDNQNQQLGVNLARQGLLLVDTTAAAFAGTVGSDRQSGFTGSYTINSGLQGALNFMAANGVSRFRNAGHLTFRSNDTPTWREFHSGGTLKVKISGGESGTASLEDIDYGLIMKVKGGLATSTMADLEVEIELSAPELMRNGDYDLKRNRISTTLNCEVGKTLVLGGMKGLVESTAGPSGVPFLRSVPVVQWFFSESENRLVDTQVLVLISPQLAGGPRAALPVSVETADTDAKAQTPNRERMEKGGRKRRFFFF